MKKSYIKPFVQVAFCLLIGLTLAGVVVQAGESPRLRVVHASPNAPNADIYVSGNRVFSDVPFSRVSEYELLAAANHTIRVLPAGAESGTPPVIEATLSFVDDQDYTLVAVGRVENLQPWQLVDENNILPQAGEARVRLIHASPDAPAVDICLAGTDDCWVTNLTFKNTSGYISLGAGSYNVDLRRNDSKEVIRNQPDVRFDEGEIYSVFVMGLLEGEPGLQFIRTVDAAHSPPPPPPPPQPPETGAFLSPTALAVLTMSILLSAVVVFWIVRRQFVKHV